jgi:hypothetical protein
MTFHLYLFFSHTLSTGKDASRAFVTGDFSEGGLIDDVDGLSDADLRGLDEWTKFYDREYSYVGECFFFFFLLSPISYVDHRLTGRYRPFRVPLLFFFFFYAGYVVDLFILVAC